MRPSFHEIFLAQILSVGFFETLIQSMKSVHDLLSNHLPLPLCLLYCYLQPTVQKCYTFSRHIMPRLMLPTRYMLPTGRMLPIRRMLPTRRMSPKQRMSPT